MTRPSASRLFRTARVLLAAALSACAGLTGAAIAPATLAPVEPEKPAA